MSENTHATSLNSPNSFLGVDLQNVDLPSIYATSKYKDTSSVRTKSLLPNTTPGSNLIGLLSNPVVSYENKPSPQPDDFRDDAKATAIANIESGLFPSVALEVVNPDPKLTYSLYTGYKMIESQSPADQDTIYRIASMSKVVTAINLMQYVENNDIKLDDPVSKYLPAFANIPVIKRIVPTNTYSFTQLTSTQNSYELKITVDESELLDLETLVGKQVGLELTTVLADLNLDGIFTVSSANNTERYVVVSLSVASTVSDTFVVVGKLDVLPTHQPSWSPYKHINVGFTPLSPARRREYYCTEPSNKQLTIRHLATHKSGMIYMDPFFTTPERAIVIALANQIDPELVRFAVVPLANFDAVEWCNKMASVPMLFHPGENWCYGMQYGIIGGLLMKYERDRGNNASLYQIQKTLLFSPLGIQSAGYFVLDNDSNRQHKVDNLSNVYIGLDSVPGNPSIKSVLGSIYGFLSDNALPGFSVSQIDGFNPLDKSQNLLHPIYGQLAPRKLELGDCGLYMTTNDYLKIVDILRNGGKGSSGIRILKKKTVNLMLQNQIGDLFIFANYIPGGQQKWGIGMAVGDDSVGSVISRVSAQWGGLFAGQWFIDVPPSNTTNVINTSMIGSGSLMPIKEIVANKTHKETGNN